MKVALRRCQLALQLTLTTETYRRSSLTTRLGWSAMCSRFLLGFLDFLSDAMASADVDVCPKQKQCDNT